jgi:hypothetical protein
VNVRQRHVVVIASGLALAVTAWTTTRLLDVPRGSGWFNYAPNSGVLYTPGQGLLPDAGWVLRDGLVWLAAVGIWAALALWLYRANGTDEPAAPNDVP